MGQERQGKPDICTVQYTAMGVASLKNSKVSFERETSWEGDAAAVGRAHAAERESRREKGDIAFFRE